MEQVLFVSVKEACRLCSLSRTTLYARMKLGDIRYVHQGRRRLVIRASLDALLPPEFREPQHGSAFPSVKGVSDAR